MPLSSQFPEELNAHFFQFSDKRFLLILVLSFVLQTVIIVIGNLKKIPKEISQEGIRQVQERYASLVLEKAVVQVKETPKATQADKGKDETSIEKKEEEKPTDQEKEEPHKVSIKEKTERRVQTEVQRRTVREKIQRDLGQVGIFAEITSSSVQALGEDVLSGVLAAQGVEDRLASIDLGSITGGDLTRKKDLRIVPVRRSGGKVVSEKVGQLEEASVSESKIDKVGDVVLSSEIESSGKAVQHAQRTMDSINKVVKTYLTRLKYVFEKHLKKDPKLNGKMKVRFSILADGSVGEIEVVSSNMGNKEFEQDVVRRIRTWTFPTIPESEGAITVVYPFVFSTSS